MTPDSESQGSRKLKQCEAIIREIGLISGGSSHSNDYFRDQARSLLVEALYEKQPRTWEDLRRLVAELRKPPQRPPDALLPLLNAIGFERQGELPES